MQQATRRHSSPVSSNSPLGAALLLALGLLLAGPALAAEDLPGAAPADDQTPPPVSQPAAQQPDAEEQYSGVERIVVTARKREENLQEVPTSIVAFSRKSLEEQDILEYDRLGQFAPNLQFMSLPSGRSTGSVQIGIRGRVQNDFLITVSNSVGFYVDDVFYGKSIGFPLEFLDIERVEVLRGPQGTLYGKNTPAGAIRVITRKPTGDWGAETDLRVGNFDFVQTRSTLNFPVLGENGMMPNGPLGTLSGKVTFLRTARDAIYDNNKLEGSFPIVFPASGAAQSAFFADGTRGTNGYLNQDRFGGQVALLWEIGDLTARYNFDIQEITDNSDAFQLDAVFTSFEDGFGGTGSSVSLLGRLNCSLLMDTSAGCHTTRDPLEALSPFVQANRSNDSPQPGPANGTVKIQGHSLTLEYGVGELPLVGDLNLKSITGYRSSKSKGIEYGTQGGPYLIFNGSQDVGYRALQQEVHAAGSGALDGNLEWLVGLYYGEEEGHQGNGGIGSMIFPSLPAWCIATPGNCFGAPQFFDFSNRGNTDIKNWSIAPFAQATYTLPLPNDQSLSFTGGLRYTYEERKATVENTSAIFTVPDTDRIAGDKAFDDVSPMGSIAWQVTEDKMLYGLISQGFRSGGFNGRGDTASTFGPFKDETVLNVELGFKTTWFDNMLQLNAAGFWQEWDDMQVTVFVPGSGPLTTVSNAAQATFWGTEIEAVAAPYDGVLLNIGYGLVLAEFDELNDLCPGTVGLPTTSNGALCSGLLGGDVVDVSTVRKVSHHPKHSLTWGASYTFPPMDYGVLSVRLGGYWQTRMNPSSNRNAHVKTNPWHTLDARIQLAEVPLFRDDVNATFALWGKNITDEKYELNGIDLGSFGFAVQNYGERATFGGQIILEWGAI